MKRPRLAIVRRHTEWAPMRRGQPRRISFQGDSGGARRRPLLRFPGLNRIGAMSVLEAQPPRFDADAAARIAAEVFGLHGSATDLGSERDATFLIDDGGGGAVLKISNLGEDAAVLDLEHAAVAHV